MTGGMWLCTWVGLESCLRGLGNWASGSVPSVTSHGAEAVGLRCLSAWLCLQTVSWYRTHEHLLKRFILSPVLRKQRQANLSLMLGRAT